MRRKSLAWAALAAMMCGLLAVMPNASGARSAHFVAAGDFGARTATRTVLDAMAAQNATAALAVGDLAYRDVAPESAWCSYVKQSFGEGFPFQLISGNHESLDVGDGLINNYSACLPNQVPGVVGTYGREYYMDFPRTNPLVRVIGASPLLTFEDGKWMYNSGDAHYQWLSNAIDAGRAAGAKWIIVAAHIPCWSVGGYNCQATDFYNLLLQKKVDLVLSGHEHNYARTHQLASGNPGCATIPLGSYNAACVRDRDGSFAAGQGTVFATVGTGGTPLRNVNSGDTEAGYFASSSGLNLNPSYGYLDIDVQEDRLGARFVTTSGGPFDDSFSIAAAAGNQPPVASFTASTSGLTASFDGSASSDPDGTISSYAWDFGDGSAPANTRTASRTYGAGGSYEVTLTVTDNAGASTSATKRVTVGSALASDTFSRRVASGWGSADTGGAYTVSGAASNYSVDGSAGTIRLSPGTSRRARLGSVSTTGADARVALGFTGTPLSRGISPALVPRVMGDAAAYRAKVAVSGAGVARVSLVRVSADGTETTLATTANSLSGMSSSKRILVRAQAVGASPTTLRAKIWFEGTPEPAGWDVQGSDSTAGLQGPGGVGLFAYQSTTSTSPVTLLVDDLQVTAP